MKRTLHRSILPAAIISIALSACATVAPVRLPLPERPPRPLVFAHELECLTPEAYERLVRRERVLEAHVERLESIIRATH